MDKSKINLFLFLLFLFSFGIFSIINPEHSTVSQTENRALKQKPVFTVQNLFSGKYFRDFEDYYSDNFPFRERFIKASKTLKDFGKSKGKDNAEIVLHNGANVAEAEKGPEEGKPEAPANENNSAESSKSEPQIQKPSTESKPISTGKILLINGSAMEVHKFNEASSRNYATTLNSFQEKAGKNVNVYSLLAPTAIEFLKDEKFKSISSSQKYTISYVDSWLNNKIRPVNTYDTLAANSDKYIYFKTDHHWTAQGAYYAYTAFMNSKGEKPVSLEQYSMDRVDGFLGSTYSVTLNKKIADNADTIYLYKPFIKHQYCIYYEGAMKVNLLDMNQANQKNKYRIFLSGDRPLGKIITEVKNGKKIAVIKDSYGNAFVPFLLPHYEEIYIIDPRQFKKNITNFVNENGIGEVLFLNYVLTTQNDDFAGLIKNMMNR